MHLRKKFVYRIDFSYDDQCHDKHLSQLRIAHQYISFHEINS